jgi:hypothetical protein
MKTFVEFNDESEMYAPLTRLEVKSRDLEPLKDTPWFMDNFRPPRSFRFCEAEGESTSSPASNYSPWHVREDGVIMVSEYALKNMPTRDELWAQSNPLRRTFNFFAEKLGFGRPLADEHTLEERIQKVSKTVRGANAAGAFAVAESTSGEFIPVTRDVVVYNDSLDVVTPRAVAWVRLVEPKL